MAEKQGASSSDKVPVAIIQVPLTAIVGQPVTFDGRESYDPNGNINFWRLRFGDDSDDEVGNAKQPILTTHAFAAPDQYEITLEVRDRQGNVDTDQHKINVVSLLQLVVPGDQVLTAPEGASEMQVDFTGLALASGGVAPYTFSFEPSGILPIGTATVKVTARSSDGQAQSGTFKVTVNASFPPLDVLDEADRTATTSDSTGKVLAIAPSVITGGQPPYKIVYKRDSGEVIDPVTYKFPVGTTVVNTTVTDVQGKTATDSFSVIITYQEPTPTPTPTGDHGLFEMAMSHPKKFWGYSLRPRAGVTSTSDPYYQDQLAIGTGKTGFRGVTYDPANDTDPNKRDGAKFTIPAFSAKVAGATPVSGTPQFTTVTDPVTGKVTHPSIPPTPLSADALDFYVPYGSITSAWYQRSVMIDDEIMGDILIHDTTTGHVSIQPRDTKHPQAGRGGWGTKAVAHEAGAQVRLSGNSISNAPHIPLPKTEDGHSYFFGWDACWTDSYIKSGLTNHKAFNFLSDGIWLEPDAVYSGGNDAIRSPLWNRETDVAAFSVRNYNILGGLEDYAQNNPTNVAGRNYAGPNVKNNDYTLPILAKFIIKPNRTIRFFVLVEQTVGYDLVTIWIGDKDGIVKTHDRLQLSLRKDVGWRIDTWVTEFNTSTDNFTGRNGSPRDLIAYVWDAFGMKDLTMDEITNDFLKTPLS